MNCKLSWGTVRVMANALEKGQRERANVRTYDAASNLTKKAYTDGTILTQMYDILNRLTTMSDWTGATTYTYDARSMMSGKTDPGNLSQAYTYDVVRNRILMVDPAGGRYTSVYDSMDRQYTQTDPAGRLFTALYDSMGRNITFMMANSSQQLSSYDALSRLITLVEATAAGTPVNTIIDTYDPGGRKTKSTVNGVAFTYVNDAINRLTAQIAPSAYATFVYDSRGNTLVKWHQGTPQVTMSYDVASRLTTEIYGASTTGFTYNQAGARTAMNVDGAISGYVYDGENRVTKVTNPDFTVVTSVYSGDGLRRAYQQPGKNLFTQIWDGANLIGEVQA